ncbi:dynamin-related protein 4C-like [Bidens hawaiensis]|uniref:dynamin-related protein 4C-like n=1 Tax=Bidens hawaiensis TaxID=980011 RepID=UPI00404B6E38
MSLKPAEKKLFLQDEIELLKDRNWPGSAKYVPATIMNALLSKKLAYAYGVIEESISNIWDYIEYVIVNVLLDHCQDCKQLHPYLQNVATRLIEDLKIDFQKKLHELLELEKNFVFTCNEEYERQLEGMKSLKLVIPKELSAGGKHLVSVEGVGDEICVDHLVLVAPELLKKAFDLKKHMKIYWKFVVERLVDNCALSIFALINDVGA